MIVYLHGFRSSPASRKATQLRQLLAARGRAAEYLCPQLPVAPSQAIEVATSLVRDRRPDEIALIGSSLGGYYATWLAERIGCKAVLLNPAIRPQDDLKRHLGLQPVYFSQEQIDFRPEYLAELDAIDTPQITRPERYFLVAATGDALINYRSMTRKYADARQRVVQGSDHELSDFAEYIEEVVAFCDGVPVTATNQGEKQ